MLPRVTEIKVKLRDLYVEIHALQQGIKNLAVIQTAVVIPLVYELKAIYTRRCKEREQLLNELEGIQINCNHNWEYECITHRCTHCGLTTEY